jgi:hypothetical protein
MIARWKVFVNKCNFFYIILWLFEAFLVLDNLLLYIIAHFAVQEIFGNTKDMRLEVTWKSFWILLLAHAMTSFHRWFKHYNAPLGFDCLWNNPSYWLVLKLFFFCSCIFSVHSFIHSRIYIALLQGCYSERSAPNSSTAKKQFLSLVKMLH